MVSAALALVACAAGCAGGGGPTPPPPSQAVVIATQPVSQVIPITQTANFTVTATGTAPRSRGESLSASQKRIRPMKSWATMFVVALNSLVSPSPFHSSE